MSSSIEGLTTVPLIFGIVTLLSFALLGRIAARKLGLPTVLGELLTGVAIGNLFYFWGYELMVVLREGATCVDIARLTLAGHSWDEAARRVLGEETGQTILDLLRGPAGSQYLQISQAVADHLRQVRCQLSQQRVEDHEIIRGEAPSRGQPGISVRNAA